MKKLILILFGLAMCLVSSAQPDKADVRRGNREFRRGHFPQADIFYRRALLADSTSFAAGYNLANALYREENLEEAGKQMERLQPMVAESPYSAWWWFNTGDIALGAKDYGKAVEAFKQVLIREPDNMEAKENYVYARLMQKNQEGGDQNQNQNQDQKQDQNQDQQDQNQDQNQDQDQQDQNQDQQNNDGDGENQPQPSGMTPQQMQQMLRAIQAKEQETQDKVNREKADALKARQKDKNW